MAKLNQDEKEILHSFEKGEWNSVKKFRSLARRYKKVAQATFKKNRRINIRISEKDLEGIQQRALIEGIPYQTLLSSLIHKYVSGILVEKRI